MCVEGGGRVGGSVTKEPVCTLYVARSVLTAYSLVLHLNCYWIQIHSVRFSSAHADVLRMLAWDSCGIKYLVGFAY